MREAWGRARESAAAVGAPRPFDPPEFAQLRRLAMAAPVPAAAAPRVLFMSWRGWSTHLAIETVLAHAVARHGGAAVFTTCGGRLPICDVMAVDAAPPMPCHSCREYAFGAIRAAGFEAVALHDVLDVASAVRDAQAQVAGLGSVRDCESFTAGGLALGRLVRVSVAWFLSRGTLPDNKEVLDTYRAFLASGIVVASGLRATLDRARPDRVFMLNGTFFAERIMSALAAERGIPFTTYEKGFLYDSIVMTPGEPACYLMVPQAAWAAARVTALTDDENAAIDSYLGERRAGGDTLDNFWRDRVDDAAEVRHHLRLASDRPVVVMFCNILWDSAVVGRDLAFASMGDWVIDGIRWAATHPGVDLVIRIHPAEVKLLNHPSRERTAELIDARAASLPSNVRVVAADDPTSSYVLMDEAAFGLVYTSTVGLEMAARGIPVLVAADTHYRDRGFTENPTTAAQYWAVADHLLNDAPDEVARAHIRELARRYAVLFFLRFNQVLGAVHEEGRSRPSVRASSDDLAPGRDGVVDRLVAGILEGADVVAPREAP